MPLCPYCRTVVGEDTRFCPECGRPLAVGEAVKGKSKKKLAGIIVTCIIAVIVIAVIATRPPTSLEPEPAIPAHFTTYTDELGLFSISYPPEWELGLEAMEETEQAVRDIISSITSDIPVEEPSVIFAAGLATGTGYYRPNVNIVVQPLSGTMWTHDRVVAAQMESLKTIASACYEFSRIKTTIGNRTATIIKYQATFPQLGTGHYLLMMCIESKTVWAVTCTAFSSEEYSEWEDDFDAIVRSLRILK